MVIANREQAARRAEASQSASVGMCQAWTRGIYGAPSVGDVDRDGDADAVDGWRAESPEHRHPGDRNPPRGVPLAWKGGSKGHGHRAVSLGNRKVRSIDVNGPGTVGTVDLDWFEKHWDMDYLGWSDSISDIKIPIPPVKVVTPPTKPAPRTRKTNLEIAREVIQGKWGNGNERRKRLTAAGYSWREVQSKVNQLLK